VNRAVGVLSNHDDGDLLATDVATLFVLSDSGRILHDNAPDRSPGPRFYLGGCQAGNIVRIRHDVGQDTAQAIERLAADEPPLGLPASTPIHLDDYILLLAAAEPVDRCSSGLTWCFPTRLEYAQDVPLVASGTPAGDQLLAHLVQAGLPQPFTALGFASVDDFWAPWCAALQDGEIASIAFAARLSSAAAETGVVTVPAFRGRGLAAAATAGWAAHPALRGRALFYGTSRTNISSQRVAARLGLRFLGASLSIT
jgi:hypothetical protein